MKDRADLELVSSTDEPFQIRFIDKSGEKYEVEIRFVDIVEIVARRKDVHNGLIETTGYLELGRR